MYFSAKVILNLSDIGKKCGAHKKLWVIFKKIICFKNEFDYENFQRTYSGGLSALLMSQRRAKKTNMQRYSDFVNPQQCRIGFGSISDVSMWFLE